MAEERFDPYALSPTSVREPPVHFWPTIGQIGPGLILAGSIVGTGELIQTTDVGARVGFMLLWLVLFSCFIKVFVQVELGRYAISSGETTLTSIYKLPAFGKLLVVWWFVMMAVTQTQLGAMVGGIGQSMHLALPGAAPAFGDLLGEVAPPFGHAIRENPVMPWAVLTTASVMLLLVVGSYRVVEIGTTALVVLFTAVTVICVGILPGTQYSFGWREIGGGLVPHGIPAHAVASALAMIGITGVGASELFSYPYWCIEKGYARNAGPRDGDPGWLDRARGWLRVMHVDAWGSMLVYSVATVAFYCMGAAVLNPVTGGAGLPKRDQMVPKLVEMYAPIFGADLARWIFVVGAIAVLYSTLFVASAGHCRMLTDFLRVTGIIELRGHTDRLRWIRRFSLMYPTIALLLYTTMRNPPLMVMIGGFVQAMTLPMISAAAIYLRYRRTDSRLVPGQVWDAFLWLSALGLLVTAGYGIWDSVLSKLFWG
jgi:Mn2+/Fe2+ NRAMP family transporter